MARRSRGAGGPITSTAATGNAYYFLRWFTRSRFALMESFLPQLDHVPTADDRRVMMARFRTATEHAQRVLLVRLVVTVLLVLAGGSTLVSSLLNYLDWLPGARDVVTRAAAVASALTIILLVARLALDRHLERVDVFATFVAMQISGARDVSQP